MIKKKNLFYIIFIILFYIKYLILKWKLLGKHSKQKSHLNLITTPIATIKKEIQKSRVLLHIKHFCVIDVPEVHIALDLRDEVILNKINENHTNIITVLFIFCLAYIFKYCVCIISQVCYQYDTISFRPSFFFF